MYKNPLNNGDLSDYNSLKNQRDYGAIINKYQRRKLKTIANETQKYYQYLTYQQSILDEANYVAERLRTENIQKNKDDYNLIEDLKIKREKEMKTLSTKEKEIGDKTLFDIESTIKQEDLTPSIITDIEIEEQSAPEPSAPEISRKSMINIAFDLFDNFAYDIDEGESFFELKTKEQIKAEKAKKNEAKITENIRKKDERKAEKARIKAEQKAEKERIKAEKKAQGRAEKKRIKAEKKAQ